MTLSNAKKIMGRKGDMKTNVKFAVAQLNDNLMKKKTLINPVEVGVCVALELLLCAHGTLGIKSSKHDCNRTMAFRYALTEKKKQLTF